MSRTLVSSASLLALSLVLAACQDDSGGAHGELASRLSTPTTLEILPPSRANIRGQDSSGGAVTVGPLAVEGGSLEAHVDDNGDLVIQDFTVDLADVLADDGTLASHPETLTNVRLSLGRALVLSDAWSTSGQSARASLYSDLHLDWSILGDDGAVVPLGSQTIEDVSINVSLHATDDGGVSAHLTATVYGRVFGNWGVVLTDFEMDVNAAASR